MSRHRILSAVLALVAVGTIGAVIYLETEDSAAQATTSASTTTSTTSTVAPTTSPPTTLPPTTTVSPTTLPPTTLAPTTALPTTTPPTTLPTTIPTTVPTTTPPTTVPPPDRGAVAVVVSSGSTTGERVRTATFLLGAGGWANIRGLNGPTPSIDTVVYYLDGFQNAAEMLALDLSRPATAIAPMAEAPPVAGLADAQLLAYLGGS